MKHIDADMEWVEGGIVLNYHYERMMNCYILLIIS